MIEYIFSAMLSVSCPTPFNWDPNYVCFALPPWAGIRTSAKYFRSPVPGEQEICVANESNQSSWMAIDTRPLSYNGNRLVHLGVGVKPCAVPQV